jgi:hypothetical protein
MHAGKNRIVVTELPYLVNKARLIEKIAELVKLKRIEGITALRDESDREAVLTAELTEEVYNKRNTGGRIVASQRRFEELTKRMNNLYTQLLILEDDPENRIARRAVRGMLNRREIFAGFTRSYVRSKSGYRWLMEYAANA